MLRSGLYNILSAVIRLGLALLTIPLLIRIIGLELYGLWSLVSAIIALAAVAEAGLSITTTVFAARDLADHDQAGLAQTLSITGGAMVLVASAVATALWFGAGVALPIPGLAAAQQAQATTALQLGAIVVWTRLLQQIFIGVEQAQNRYGLLNALLTVQAVLANLGAVIVAYRGGRIIEMMAWQVAVGVLMLVAHAAAVWRLLGSLPLHPTWSWPRARVLGRYSLLTWASSLGGALFTQCDRLIVGALLGVSPLAVYAAIANIAAQINALSALPVQPLLPHLGARAGGAPDPALKPQLRQALTVNAFVACALGGSLLMLSAPLIQVILAQMLTAELRTAMAAAIAIYSLYSLNAVGYYLLLGLRAVWICTATVIMCGALALALIAIGARLGGLTGAIMGNMGYLGTLYLTWRGMRMVQVPPAEWLAWLAFPLLWFGGVALVAIWAPEPVAWRLPLLTLALALLGGWFLNRQRSSIEPLIRRLAARLK